MEASLSLRLCSRTWTRARLPNLSITPEGGVSHDPTGLDEGQGQLHLNIVITRDDLL
jgi:hypothetical protein